MACCRFPTAIRYGTIGRPSPATRGATLGIDRPGVYPLLLNLNGKPAYGGAARLDDSRTLLPVLGLPDGSADTP
ncbi:hypothetical protein PJN93_30635, partial [Mycobacterium kansasii]